jgi:hypothetical protein
MKKIYLITKALIFTLVLMVSCVDLNILPSTVLSSNEIYNEQGITAYFAGIYRNLPMEDFKYSTNETGGSRSGYSSNQGMVWSFWYYTGEATNRNNTGGMARQVAGYWGDGWSIIRQANTLIKELPDYPDLSTKSPAWIAEAKFIRAYVYFQMTKRYGGLPKITEPQVLDLKNTESLFVKRESHADTYDFILQDLDEAINGLPETQATGRADKNVAIALKSRVALYAATTARYGSAKFADWTVDGVLLQGIPTSKANEYFKISWDAAKMLEGKYELHKENADKAANFAEVWEKADGNKESIWIRKFQWDSYAHSYDSYMGSVRHAANGDRFNVTLDWVELFDGLPLDYKGNFSAADANGDYIVYDDCQQLWNGAEPRLRACILLPGETYRDDRKVEIRTGIIDKKYNPVTDKFKKFSVDNGTRNYYSGTWNETDYPRSQYPNGLIYHAQTNPAGFLYCANADHRDQYAPGYLYEHYELSPGSVIHLTGMDGPGISTAGGGGFTATGILGRKYLNVSMPRAEAIDNNSTQPWIEIRYGEMLLNRAEAAIELAQNGEASYGGTNMLQDAFNCINAIRDRGGAELLSDVSELSTAPAFTQWSRPGPKGKGGFVVAPNRALQILRVERYKELAFESKLYWDLLRWFTFDEQINQYQRRGLYSFLFASTAVKTEGNTWSPFIDGKYIYDAKGSENGAMAPITFTSNLYYETIPAGELQANPLLQPNRFN